MISNDILQSGDSARIRDAVRALASWEHKKIAVTLLKHTSLAMYYEVLALLYDVWVYAIGPEEVANGAPAHAKGKYFPSTNATEFTDAPQVPLAKSMAYAYELACKIYGLEALFERECAAGKALPRQVFSAPVPSLDKQLAYVVTETRKFEPMSPSELGLKGAEEYGEFGTAVLVETGRLAHKELKEPSFGEAADVILCMVSALAKLHPHMTPAEISDELARWLYLKQLKYDVLLQQHEQAAQAQ